MTELDWYDELFAERMFCRQMLHGTQFSISIDSIDTIGTVFHSGQVHGWFASVQAGYRRVTAQSDTNELRTLVCLKSALHVNVRAYIWLNTIAVKVYSQRGVSKGAVGNVPDCGLASLMYTNPIGSPLSRPHALLASNHPTPPINHSFASVHREKSQFRN